MKQTVDAAAKAYCEENIPSLSNLHLSISTAFEAGAEWQTQQSPWIKVGDRNYPMKQDEHYLFLLEDGTVVDENDNPEDRCLLILAYMPVPSFDDILEANKDVLKRGLKQMINLKKI